ncbi:Ger(x)C family spore germination protein [Proteiniborus sp. MB09-C3]|uniref:Ger(x)C family spore germination protein n=1 Tax=Proteiniborus sp. MB09-C3 TaxID=3050072 RepID=UPI002554CA19|nr:Ger(x)C family spore germination protein [Proteiniborus sp. MB09-C3]WIV12992.1 Ger(x)C family spore germination protein [Proteiniborus sp. MB09-C3]
MKRLKIILLVMLLALLTGCWDKIEMEEIGYVAVIGVDKAENNKIKVTFQITNPTGVSLEGQPNEKEDEIVTILANDLVSVKDLANISISRHLTYNHARAIIISEELAKTDKLFSLMAATQRDRDIRRELNIIICKENAADFIRNNNPPFTKRTAKYFEFMTSRWEDVGFSPLSDLHRYLQRSTDAHDLFLATYATTILESPNTLAENVGDYIAGQVYDKEKNPTQMMGSAVMKNGKMIGIMTGTETRLALLMRSKKITNNIHITFPDPLDKKEQITAKLMRKKTKIDVNIDEEYPIINVTVPVRLSISSIPSLIDYVENQENQKILQASIEEYLENESMKLIERTQKEFGGDPFLWSTSSRKNFWLYEDFIKYNWIEKYPKAKVDVNFEVRIEDFGKSSTPPKIGEINK